MAQELVAIMPCEEGACLPLTAVTYQRLHCAQASPDGSAHAACISMMGWLRPQSGFSLRMIVPTVCGCFSLQSTYSIWICICQAMVGFDGTWPGSAP